jgi:hypothetical protein
MVPTYYNPTFPSIHNFSSFRSFKANPARNSLTPLRYRKYVESVLDTKIFRKQSQMSRKTSFSVSKTKL